MQKSILADADIKTERDIDIDIDNETPACPHSSCDLTVYIII